jgi:hypothetical protein
VSDLSAAVRNRPFSSAAAPDSGSNSSLGTTTALATGGSSTQWWRRPVTWLIAVAVVHAVGPLLLLSPHWWFGVDETVYLSQINSFVPPGGFSPPRSRGMTLIAAPVTLLTPSVTAVRLWMAALSGVALFVAFRPWLRMQIGFVTPLAALLFSSIWSVIHYSFEVMPNEWVAVIALASCGYLLLFLNEGRARHLIVASVALGLVALMRLPDAAYVGPALGISALCVGPSTRRRLVAAAGLLVGAAAGAVQWVVEAETRFGGLLARMHAAQAQDGSGGRFYLSAPAHAEVLGGQILCAAPCRADSPVLHQLWWIAVGTLVVAGVVGGWRRRRLAIELVPVAVGLVIAAQYLFTVQLVAPRYLIPAYALLCVPAASGALYLLQLVGRRAWRIVAGCLLWVLLIAHTAIQVTVIETRVKPAFTMANNRTLAEARKLRKLGVHPPCHILGQPGWSQNLAYALRCTNHPRDVESVHRMMATGTRVVWLMSERPPARFGTEWTRVKLPGLRPSTPQVAYLSFKPS